MRKISKGFRERERVRQDKSKTPRERTGGFKGNGKCGRECKAWEGKGGKDAREGKGRGINGEDGPLIDGNLFRRVTRTVKTVR